MGTVILTAATIAIVIPASLWTGSLYDVFTRYENIEIKNTYVVNSGGNYVVTIEYVNTGSSSASIDAIDINGISYSSYIPSIVLTGDLSTLPSPCETGELKTGIIIIKEGATDPSGNKLSAGVILVLTLHTTNSKKFHSTVSLQDISGLSSTVQGNLGTGFTHTISSTNSSEDNADKNSTKLTSGTTQSNSTSLPNIVSIIYFKSDNEIDPSKEWRGEIYNEAGGGEIYGDRTSVGPSDAELRQNSRIKHSGTYAAEWYVGNVKAQIEYPSQVKGIYWRINQREAYYSTWYYFPDSFHGSIGGWCNIMQWKDCSSPYDPVGIVIVKEYIDGTWLTVQEWHGEWGDRLMKLPKGRWFQLQIYYKVGIIDGEVKVWVDGKLMANWTNIRTRGSGSDVMWGIGYYPDFSHPPNQSFYTDDTYVTNEFLDPNIWIVNG